MKTFFRIILIEYKAKSMLKKTHSLHFNDHESKVADFTDILILNGSGGSCMGNTLWIFYALCGVEITQVNRLISRIYVFPKADKHKCCYQRKQSQFRIVELTSG